MRSASLLWISMLLFGLAGLGIAAGANPVEQLRAGDHLFNQGKPDRALALYRQALQGVEGREPDRVLRSEILNNIAAAYLAQGDEAQFRYYFGQATSLKWQLGQAAARRRDGDPLLVDGGFEKGLLPPWGTGHYERAEGRFHFGLWWNSMNARAFMKIDSADKHSGAQSLRITNYSPAAPHVFTTLSQRITGLKPNTVYRLSYFAKAENLAPGAASFAIDAAWVKRFHVVPPGTYDWQALSGTINIGHNDSIDFRIIHQNTGTLWLDDIEISEVESVPGSDLLHRVESLFDQAEYEEALRICLELERRHRDQPGTLRHVRLHLGRIYQVLGQYERALAALDYAVDHGLPRATIDLARLHFELGDYDTAGRFFMKSLQIVEGDQGTTSLVLHELSRCYLAQSRLEQALEMQARSIRILKHIDDRHGQALSLKQRGEIHQRQHQNEEAQKAYRQALDLAGQLGDRKLASDILIQLADLSFQARQWERALDSAREALEIKETIHDSIGRVRALHLCGRLAVAGSRPEEARRLYGEAISTLEKLSSTVSEISREARATFIRQFNQLYREYVELLLQAWQQTHTESLADEALQVVEQARSRAFTEMIEESRTLRAVAAGSPPELEALLNGERSVALKIQSLNQQLRKARETGDAANIGLLGERVAGEEARRKELRARLIREYPRYADLSAPQRLRSRDIQALLGPDEAVLSYFVTAGRTGLWALTRERVQLAVIPFARVELIRKSESFRRGFADIASSLSRSSSAAGSSELRTAFAGYRPETAQELYETLVGPVALLLRDKTTVHLALDDLLYKLPFEALLTGEIPEATGRGMNSGDELVGAPFWVKTHSLSYLPSLSVLRSLRTLDKQRVAAQAPLLAFADPIFRAPAAGNGAGAAPAGTRSLLLRNLKAGAAVPALDLAALPDTRDEALHVARLLGASVERDVYLQGRATEKNLKHLRLKDYRNLLFATHGLLAGEFGPGTQPALVLSFVNDPENDGLLEMGEIFGLDLNADLAVLSACNTASGSGEDDRGEGFAGLTRSFMYAGARSLLVTQWSVESGSAKRLVQATFAHIKEGRPKTEALALAKRAFIAGDRLIQFGPDLQVSEAHPFFWAPYILVGEVR